MHSWTLAKRSELSKNKPISFSNRSIFLLATPETVRGFEVDLCPNSSLHNLKDFKQNVLPQRTHTLCFMNGLFIAVVLYN